MKWCLLLLVFLAVAKSQTPTSKSQGKVGEDKAFEVTSGLYTTLRNVAFPNHKLTDDTPVESRFLMLMPGKVLNYFDYYPGSEYTNFIKVSELHACMY